MHVLTHTRQFIATLAILLCAAAPAHAGGWLPDSGGGDTYVPKHHHKIPIDPNIMVGKQAPDFEAMTSEGQTVRLSDFKGRMIVLEWHNPECPFVKKHYESGNMQRLQNYARSEKLIWLTINSSGESLEGYLDPRKAQAYYQKHDMKANHYLIDPEGKIGGAYGAKTTPDMVIIDTGGYIAYTGAIDNIPTTDPNDIAKAKNYVQSAIENLLMGKPAVPYATQPYGCSVKYKKR